MNQLESSWEANRKQFEGGCKAVTCPCLLARPPPPAQIPEGQRSNETRYYMVHTIIYMFICFRHDYLHTIRTSIIDMFK